MNERDWDFAIGDLGDPLADIEPWMTPPRPAWVARKEAAHMDQTAQEVIRKLLSLFPDSDEQGLEWDCAWDTLSQKGQERVSEARYEANVFLNNYEGE